MLDSNTLLKKYPFLRPFTNIINKYEQLSKNTCCECGAPAIYISTGWICPWCEQHAPEGSQLIINTMEQ